MISSLSSTASAAMGGFDMCVHVCGLGVEISMADGYLNHAEFYSLFSGSKICRVFRVLCRVFRVQESSPPHRQEKRFSDRC